MKRFIAIFVSIYTLGSGFQLVSAQSCLPENLNFNDQFTLDHFAASSGHCTVVDGNVNVNESIPDKITHLESLSGIRVIRGSLIINHNHSLKNLNGLEGIDSVYQDVQLSFMDSLESIQALQNIKFIGGSLTIRDCSRLMLIDTFQYLETLNKLNLIHSPGTPLIAFSKLKSATSIEIQANAIEDLKGFNALEYVGTLTISSNDNLTSLTALSNLKQVQNLNINHNDLLQDLSGLDQLNLLTGQLSVTYNDTLSSLAALSQLDPDSIDLIQITNNRNLSVCHLDFICSTMFRPEAKHLIQANGDGCRSYLVVAAACSIGCPENMYFHSQEDVDQFPSLFPDCGDVMGTVLIQSMNEDPIRNLDSLSTLTSIGGDLKIESNYSLEQLTGLGHLGFVGHDIRIRSNGMLQHLYGLEGVTQANDLFIQGNTQLADLQGLQHLREVHHMTFQEITSLEGLDELERVTGNVLISGRRIKQVAFAPLLDTIMGVLSIRQTDSVLSLTGLEHLKVIGGLYLSNTQIDQVNGLSGLRHIVGDFNVLGNEKLISLQGMDLMQTIGGSIRMMYNPELTDLTPLQDLDSIHGSLILTNNEKLLSVNELQHIQYIADSCYLVGNYFLNDYSGFNQLNTVGKDLFIIGQDLLIDFSDFHQLHHVGGNFLITDNYKLQNLLGLENLDSISGGFYIASNDMLGSLEGIQNLQSIGLELSVQGNKKLVSLDGFKSLHAARSIEVLKNPELAQMDSLSNLMGLKEGLTVTDNFKLERLPNFFQLRTIEGDVTIENNRILQNLHGLDSIESITGKLNVKACGMLSSLSGLDQLTSCGNGLYLEGNGLVNLDPLEHLTAINGPLVIENNFRIQNLEGLRNIDPQTIAQGESEYAISLYFNDELTDCSIDLLCTALEAKDKVVRIGNNGTGCNTALQIQRKCDYPYGCLKDDLILHSQSEIDQFPSTYPACTFVQGDVIVQETVPGDILNVDSLAQLKMIGASLRFIGNTNLVQVDSFIHLNTVGGVLFIENNNALENLEGLKNIDPEILNTAQPFVNDLVIRGNPLLSACAITPVCSLLTTPNSKYAIEGNAASCAHKDSVLLRCGLPTVCTLGDIRDQLAINYFPIQYPYCTEVQSRLFIDDQYGTITSLAPLKQIEKIHGGITIKFTEKLTSLDGLEQIQSIDGPLEFYWNDKLADIHALENISVSSILPDGNSYLTIQHNPVLSDCAIYPICEIVSLHSSGIYIFNNKTNCNSGSEILAMCTVNVEENGEERSLRVYPNPTSGELNIASDSFDFPFEKTFVYDGIGRMVYAGEFSSQLDLADYPDGIYTLVCTDSFNHRYLVRVVLIR